jgi:transposase
MVKSTKRQIRQLKTALHWNIPDLQRQRIRMVLLREGNMTQPAIAAAMGVSLSTVNRAHMAYDQGGIKALKPKPCGGRQRQNMTIAAEAALLARFAKAAGAGEMLNIHDLKSAYEQAIGHPTSNSTIYNLLDRHRWRKLMPRPFHPQRDVEAQNAFKKKALLAPCGARARPPQDAVAACGSCSPTKRGSAASTGRGRVGRRPASGRK